MLLGLELRSSVNMIYSPNKHLFTPLNHQHTELNIFGSYTEAYNLLKK